MTDLRKAAEMALERLESHEYWMDEEAIQALRQALSNQFNPDWNQVESLQEALREHMAEIQRLRQALAQPELEQKAIEIALEMFDVECMCGICKLGKREWVGLTDEEIKEYKWMGQDVLAVIKEVQATLKERNT